MKLFSVSDSGKIIFWRRLALFSVIKDRRKYFPLKWRKTNLGYFLPLGWNIKIMGSTYSYYHQMNLIQMFFEAGRSWPVKKVFLLLRRSWLSSFILPSKYDVSYPWHPMTMSFTLWHHNLPFVLNDSILSLLWGKLLNPEINDDIK